jgi:outer membrane PBP1 activator LpoA protein
MLLSFSLSPEREGELLAKRLLAKKFLKISVFSQNSESNNRILASMQKVFNAGGGAIISTMPTPRFNTDASTGVITPPVMPANLLQSQAIVLIMPSNDAKSVKSALSLNSASAIPLLATASVFDTNNAQLDGIEFMQMPWLIGQSNAANVYNGQLSKLPSAKSVSGSRLNAFGVDAWLISTHLQAWLNNPNGELNGATGSLHLEPNGTIELKLPWFVIRNGVPQPADVGQP